MSLKSRLALILFVPVLAGALPQNRDEQPRRLRYRFTLINTTPRPVEGVELWACAPVKKTSSQECLNLESSIPFEKAVDSLGNQSLHFRMGDIAPYGRRAVTVDAVLLMSVEPSAGKTSYSRRRECLRPEPFMESDSPEILRLAASLRGKTSRETSGNIFRWVSTHLGPSAPDLDPHGALYALKKGRGDCTEAMDLAVALGRAAGVPTRGVAGYVCPESAPLDPAAFHNWAEFLDGGRWLLSDPSRRVFSEKSREYVAFKIIGGTDGFNRFRVKGDGIDVRMDGGGAS